ncbi:MAG TPA: flagellar biosynthesis protein FlgB [Terriglobales bacterium]|nr:flagellar biosynthesis protein FlgB [Terriglobales bacterium]
MSLIESNTLTALGRYLNVAAFRQGLIATNMANIDTPGYRTRDLDFRTELQRSQCAKPQVSEVPGLLERPDGNNVSVDRESMLLAQTQLQFRVGVQLIRAEFRRFLTAINEGRQ